MKSRGKITKKRDTRQLQRGRKLLQRDREQVNRDTKRNKATERGIKQKETKEPERDTNNR